MVADLHVGGGGAVQQARALFAQNPEFKMGAVNAETGAPEFGGQNRVSAPGKKMSSFFL